MSIIYSKCISIVNKISYILKNSFIFQLIYSIGLFFETQWINSYFKKLYPNKNFLKQVNKSIILKKHIFNPLIVLLIFALFLSLSLNQVNFDLQITLAIAFIFFFIGSTIIPYFLLNNTTDKPLIEFNYEDLYSIGFCLIIISIIFFFITIASVGGIPILKPSLRYSLKAIFTMPVFLIIPGVSILGSVYIKKFKDKKITRSQTRFRFIILTLISGAFLLCLGYRTHLLAILLVMIILGYYGDILAVWEVVIGALLGVMTIIGIGYYRSLGELTVTSSTSPFYFLQNRADFTLGVLEKLNILGGTFGTSKGQIIASSIPGSANSPRMIVGKLISWRSEVSVTPTLIGQMVADFGKVGVAFQMTILGFILGIGYKIMQKTQNYFYIGLYSLILTYTCLGIETGILDIQVLLYFTIAFILYITYIGKSRLKVLLKLKNNTKK